MNNQQMVLIGDDQVGEGQQLALPAMSSCTACICVLSNRLVGVHKTSQWDGNTNMLFAQALQLIGSEPVRELYIAGWNVYRSLAGRQIGALGAHDATLIRNMLRCAAVPTYICNYNNYSQNGKQSFRAGLILHAAPTIELCTFAIHNGSSSPIIGVKRSSKVNYVLSPNADLENALFLQHYGPYNSRFHGNTASFSTHSNHLHRLRKYLEFTRI